LALKPIKLTKVHSVDLQGESKREKDGSGPLRDLDELDDVEHDELTVTKYENQAHKDRMAFRNYEDNPRKARVTEFYTLQHKFQTMEFVQSARKEFLAFNHGKMGVWEALELLNSLVDDSDPDIDLSQLQHALQTAEAIRSKHPDKDWMAVTGLIHDLGKLLGAKFGQPQWAVVGDTFPVGCKFSPKCVFYDKFTDNPDSHHEVYSTENGVYQPGCGLSNLLMSWGHDEYLYQVCVKNKCTLPIQGLYMIRFHSFYPWHRERAYTQFEDETDKAMLPWILEFNQFDLYSKADCTYNYAELKDRYQKLILKYFPETLEW
jgi:inositol oxygenase